MRISTRTRYGMRAMVELARAYPSGALSVKDVARRQKLSVKYLEKIVALLKAAGLIRAVRGSHGGYELTMPPDRIPASDVFGALEGPPMLVDCVRRPEVCPMESVCPTRELWEAMGGAMSGILAETTLEELAGRGGAPAACMGAEYEI